MINLIKLPIQYNEPGCCQHSMRRVQNSESEEVTASLPGSGRNPRRTHVALPIPRSLLFLWSDRCAGAAPDIPAWPVRVPLNVTSRPRHVDC